MLHWLFFFWFTEFVYVNVGPEVFSPIDCKLQVGGEK